MDCVTLGKITSIMKKKSIAVSYDMTFRKLTTLGCGGKIKLTVYPDSFKKLSLTVKLLQKLNVHYVVLGKGSNTLASDEDFDGVVISTLKMNKVSFWGSKVFAQAGASAVFLAKRLQQRGLGGGEFLACLPASVGGAAVCNAGCFSQDMASVTQSVCVLHNGKIKRLSASKCNYGKRRSLFKNNPDYVVLGVKLALKKSDPDKVRAVIDDMRRRKASAQPLNYRSAGCVLYHDRVAVSRLMDEAGLKGYKVGQAEISAKHAGFVVNVDKARSKDIYLIILHAKNTLYSRYGICAKVEVNLVNFTKDEENDLFAGSKNGNS